MRARHVSGVVPAVVPLLTGVLLTLVACAGPSGRRTDPASTTSSTASSAGSSAASSGAESFPLRLTRSGGIAGFRDSVVVGADGVVELVRRDGTAAPCRLTASALETLRTAASSIDWAGATPATTTPGHADDMVQVVLVPGRPATRLEDPRVAALHDPLTALLVEVTTASQPKVMCR